MTDYIPKISKWTDEEKQVIADLLKKNYSASQIGAAVGKTRNSIIGIVTRDETLRNIGFSRKTKPPEQRKIRTFSGPRPQRAAPPKRKKIAGYSVKLVKKAEVVDSIESPRMVDLMDLRSDMCHYPIGDPKQEGFGYCGNAIAARKYCGHHYNIMFREQ